MTFPGAGVVRLSKLGVRLGRKIWRLIRKRKGSGGRQPPRPDRP